MIAGPNVDPDYGEFFIENHADLLSETEDNNHTTYYTQILELRDHNEWNANQLWLSSILESTFSFTVVGFIWVFNQAQSHGNDLFPS
jgi:hypothetical protein